MVLNVLSKSGQKKAYELKLSRGGLIASGSLEMAKREVQAVHHSSPGTFTSCVEVVVCVRIYDSWRHRLPEKKMWWWTRSFLKSGINIYLLAYCMIEEMNKAIGLLAFLFFLRQGSSVYEVYLLSCVFINASSQHICMQKKLKYSFSVVFLKLSKDPKSYLVFCGPVSSQCHGSAQIFQDEKEILDSRLKYCHV